MPFQILRRHFLFNIQNSEYNIILRCLQPIDGFLFFTLFEDFKIAFHEFLEIADGFNHSFAIGDKSSFVPRTNILNFANCIFEPNTERSVGFVINHIQEIEFGIFLDSLRNFGHDEFFKVTFRDSVVNRKTQNAFRQIFQFFNHVKTFFGDFKDKQFFHHSILL